RQPQSVGRYGNGARRICRHARDRASARPSVKESPMSILERQDPAVYRAIKLEEGRQRDKIELITSENYVSRAVYYAAVTVLTNKYAEGYPGHRYYGGCEYVDLVEDL